MAEALRSRIISSSITDSSAEQVSTQTRFSHYKLWTEEQMVNALDAVLRNNYSISRAAIEYNVPKSTLRDRVKGKVKPGVMSGPMPYLTLEEERALVAFLLRCASIGYAKSRKQVLTIVQRLLTSRKIDRRVTDGWWTSFQRRNPDVCLRTPAPLCKARAAATDRGLFEKYFDLLEQTLDTYNLRGRPCLIWNMDETGVPLNPPSPKVVTSTEHPNPICIKSGDRSQVTVVACVSAAGVCLPPMVIWNRKTFSAALTEGEVAGTMYGLSAKGWMDSELFDGWFRNHFLRYVPADWPILLLLDGHSSHFCPETIEFAAAQGVVVFALPPHTTHLSQPLDKGCFSPLKKEWENVCHKFTSENPGKVVTKYSFSKLFTEAWNKKMTICNILAGFSTTGVYPVNRQTLLSKIPDGLQGTEQQCASTHGANLDFFCRCQVQCLLKNKAKHILQRPKDC